MTERKKKDRQRDRERERQRQRERDRDREGESDFSIQPRFPPSKMYLLLELKKRLLLRPQHFYFIITYIEEYFLRTEFLS